MYDVVVVGQGLSGMLSAIWAREQGYRTALVATGTGKIMQATGVMDLLPGSDGGLKEWMEFYQVDKSQLKGAIHKFNALTERIGYPYMGDIENLITIVTGSGHVKKTALYPMTISPLPEHGHVVIVGFHEVLDFQPDFIKGNLQKARPNLSVDAMKIKLGKHSQRTMTQLDAARLLDLRETRDYCIKQIKSLMLEKNISKPDLFVFPASLGVENWQELIQYISTELVTEITEAPGMPPNTTAIRLNERLKKEAVKLGVRFYADTTVMGCKTEGNQIKSLSIKTANQLTDISGKKFILATGGILGGGLEVIPTGVKETALNLEVDENGAFLHCPTNLYPVGASKGTSVTLNGITGGVYSIVSSYETVVGRLHQESIMGGTYND